MDGKMADSRASLADLKPGECGVVAAFLGNTEMQLRLMELGLLPGTAVRCLRTAPLGDPLEVELRGYNLSLRRKEAAAITLHTD